MLVKDFLIPAKKFPNYDGEIGLEIETETKKPYDTPSFFFWNTHTDGSLRDFGIEYVLKQPVKFEMLRAALEEFELKTGKIPFIKDSFSTSVHVHLNMLNESLVTLGSFLTSYTLVENLLIRHSGDNRLSNLFCLPIKDAEDTYKNMVSLVSGFPLKNYRTAIISENSAKYGALNLAALGKYGSLEVRSFRGETDPEVIYQWVVTLYNILTYARENSPKKILEDFRINKMKVVEDILGKGNPILKVKDAEDLVEENLYFSARVAAAVKNWEELDVKEKKKTPTKSQLNSHSMAQYGKAFEDLPVPEQIIVMEVVDKNINSPFYKTVKTRSKRGAPVLNDWVPLQNNVIQNGALINPVNDIDFVDHDAEFEG